MKRPTKEDVERETAELDQLDTKALQQRWREIYGREPPPRIRAVLLRRFIAYQLQVLAFGGLKPKTIRLLRKLAAELREKRAKQRAGIGDNGGAQLTLPRRPAVLSPGTQLMREWDGSTEIVDVTDDGFIWRGRTFTTLSAAAAAITGTKWSGPRFFGLRTAGQKPKPATKGEELAP